MIGQINSGTAQRSAHPPVQVTRNVLEAIVNHARFAVPRECCGLLLGVAGRITHAVRAANISPQPDTRFEIDPQVLIDAERQARAGGPQVLGFYHSHPAGPARPSATDREEAAHDGRVWAIIGDSAVTFWRDEEAGFVPLSYMVEVS